MDNGKVPKASAEGGEEEEGEENGLEWLLRSEVIPAPMDTNVSLSSVCAVDLQSVLEEQFTRESIFSAASCGDASQLDGLLDFLRANKKRLSGPEFTDVTNGKTALLKALLNLKDGENPTVEVLLQVAEETGDLEGFINASYTDPFYKGQSALHVAIERRSLEHVKLLVQKGADVQAKASGQFFQRNAELGFYFGELPLSLAACTNQPQMVSFLMENPYCAADLSDRDSQGNTVLHALVVLADDTPENTNMILAMYDQILIHNHRLQRDVALESIQNNKGLTPVKLAAKLGKIGLLRHMLQRELPEKEMRPLSRKFTEWVYGPVCSSLYDTSSIDTSEENSVLEIIVFGSQIPNRTEMLHIEPLRSLLQDKWDRFASKLFLTNFLAYLGYLLIFTLVVFYRKEGQPPFPVENEPVDVLRCVGELISLLGSVWFLYKAVKLFRRNPPTFKSLYTDGFCDILFFLQALLLLLCALLYSCGRREYVGLLVISLALAWINVLYYCRGFKQLGMYNVMMQRMILGDILFFLGFYGVFLFGFSAAVVSLIEDTPLAVTSDGRGRAFGEEPFKCEKPSYNDIRFTTLELFKFTIGMGDLQFTDHVQYKEIFYVLLILYIVLTYILLLNMLIALMGNTVEKISGESQSIWNLQRALTILDMEGTLPQCLMSKLFPKVSKMVCLRNDQDECRKFFRVEEINWRQWRSDVGVIQEEDPQSHMMVPTTKDQTQANPWRINSLLERIRARRRTSQQSSIP